MQFKVVTTILATPTTNVQYTCINTSSTTHRFHEPLSDSYTLDLAQYRYTIVSTNNSSHCVKEGLVKDLVGFELVGKDCTIEAVDYFRLALMRVFLLFFYNIDWQFRAGLETLALKFASLLYVFSSCFDKYCVHHFTVELTFQI